MRRFSLSVFLLLFSISMSGCDDGQNVKVWGKLLKNGTKYTPPAGHNVAITFIAFDVKDVNGKSIDKEPFEAIVDDETMSFTVPGREGHGIPPGKYRVAVTQRMSREAFDAEKPKTPAGMRPVTRETDFLWGRFSSEKSPIFRSVDGQSEIVIDLEKPE